MKSWVKSRTNGFGGLLALLGIAIVTLPELQDVISQLPSEYQGYIALAIGIAVVIFRHITIGPTSTNVKAMEIEYTTREALNHYGFLEAILIKNNVPLQGIESDMEIEELWLRDIYTVWNVMKQARKLKEE